MYGGRQSQFHLDELETIRQKAKDEGKSFDAVSDQLVNLGWKYLSEGDVATAIKRFNQAWLTKPDNYKAFWGFAVILVVRDNDLSGSLDMFERAESLSETHHANFYVEYGRTCEAAGELDKAITLAFKGLALNPKIRDGYIVLMVAYGRKGEYDKALKWMKIGAKLGLFPEPSMKEIKANVAAIMKMRKS